MFWTELANGFRALREKNDFDAHWRYAPDEAPHETWNIVAPEGLPPGMTVVEFIQTAGSMLSVTLEGTRALPPRLLADRRSPGVCWLAAIRRKGLNVVNEPGDSWRVDQGSIVNVLDASVRLCIELQASETARRAAKASGISAAEAQTVAAAATAGSDSANASQLYW